VRPDKAPPENCFVLDAIPLIVIAGRDPVIPADSGGCGDHRNKSGDDGEEKLCPSLSFILTRVGGCPAVMQWQSALPVV
jgi:hypothetical protein